MNRILALLTAFIIAACATDTGNPERDRSARVTNALLKNAARHIGEFAVASLQNAVAKKVNGQNVDFASAASVGLWSSLPNIISSDDIKTVIDAYSGPAAPAIVNATAPQIAAISTPQQAQAVAVSIASGLDTKTAAIAAP